jgi:hypothetical protein
MDVFDAVFEGKEEKQAIPPAEQPAEPPQMEPQAEAPAPEAAQPPIETAPPEPAPQRDDRNVPLVALLDEREKRKALEAELAQLRAKAEPQQPANVPDPYDDPEGYHAFVNDVVQRQTLAIKFDLSESMAKAAHGYEAVEAAKEWGAQRAQSDPSFQRAFITAQNPMDWVVRQHKQEEDLALYRKDPVAFAKAVLERSGQPTVPDAAAAIPAVAGQQPQAPRPAAPPRSIASAPSSGGPRDVATGPLAAVDAIFAR